MHLRAKGLVGTWGVREWRFKNSFLFPICIIQKSDHFSLKIKPYIYRIGNQMQNHKIETNSELIYEDGSI